MQRDRPIRTQFGDYPVRAGVGANPILLERRGGGFINLLMTLMIS